MLSITLEKKVWFRLHINSLSVWHFVQQSAFQNFEGIRANIVAWFPSVRGTMSI